jgi:hypothetical protein
MIRDQVGLLRSVEFKFTRDHYSFEAYFDSALVAIG